MSKDTFISDIASAVRKYAPSYGIAVASPIIAQAILESNWGESYLSSKYNNYFGLKCGSSWNGKSVNMSTHEEYTPGTSTVIRDNFRVFDSLDEGVKGYFDFLQYDRYKNLKGVTDYADYICKIKEDGYATSSKYVDSLMNLVKNYNLTRFDDFSSPETSTTPSKSNEDIANEVIKGLWGNGGERKQKLSDAGYDYDAIKSIVNSRYNKTVHIVKQGDTLSAIAKKYNTSVNSLAQKNGIKNPNLIYVGQRIEI